jgi:hypothetical protein
MHVTNLLRFIITSSCLDKDDILFVKDLIRMIDISLSNLTDLNKQIADQIKIESGCIYLVGKYTEKLNLLEVEKDTLKSKLIIGVPDEMFNKKLTAEKRNAFIITDDDYNKILKEYAVLDAFVKTVNLVQRLIFGRSNKLETISTNYRRELKSDENN